MTDPNEKLLYTVDGHPIGELVIADGSSAPVPDPAPAAVAECETAIERRAATELSETVEEDPELLALFPGYADAGLRSRAREMFIAESKPIDEIAETLSVPPRTVSRWICQGRWEKIVLGEIEARRLQANLELARVRSVRRVETVRRQLDEAKRIQEIAVKAAEEAGENGGRGIQGAATAWAAAAKAEQALVGINGDSGAVAEETPAEQAKAGKTPLVVVFNGSASGIPTLGGAK